MSGNLLSKLIETLTKSEKKHFRRFARMSGSDPDYLKLFDEIQGGKDPLSFSGTDLVNKKGYLKANLLKSLAYQSDSHEKQGFEFLDSIRRLKEKGLYKLASKEIRKAKGWAKKHEEFEVWLKLVRWEIEMGGTSEGLVKEEIEIISLQDNLLEYHKLKARTRAALSEYHTPDPKISMVRSILTSKYLEDESCAKSIRAKQDFYWIKKTCFLLLENFKAAESFSWKLIGIYEEQAKQKHISDTILIRELGDLWKLTTKTENKDLNDEVSRKINSFRGSSLEAEAFYYDRFVLSEFIVAFEVGNFDRCLKYSITIENKLPEIEQVLGERKKQRIQYFLAYFYFLIGDFIQAQKWIRKIILRKKADVLLPIMDLSNLLNLVILYEVGDIDLLESKLRSISRQFRINPPKFKYFEEIVILFKRLSRVPLESHIEEISKSLIRMNEMKEEPFESKAFRSFDLTIWMESKQLKLSANQVIKNRNSTAKGRLVDSRPG